MIGYLLNKKKVIGIVILDKMSFSETGPELRPKYYFPSIYQQLKQSVSFWLSKFILTVEPSTKHFKFIAFVVLKIFNAAKIRDQNLFWEILNFLSYFY